MTNYNRRKFQIFLFLSKSNDSVTADELISNLNMTPGNAWQRLSKMYLQGYLTRNKRGHYRLSTKGTRILEKLQVRKDMEKKSGKDVSFNLRKRPL